jgi:hypothetical protein
VITAQNGTAPEYFNSGFFNGTLDFSWTAEGVDPAVPHGHGKIIDFTYAAGSEAVNFGDSDHQAISSLGSLDPLTGFINTDGRARDSLHHSVGCYEP